MGTPNATVAVGGVLGIHAIDGMAGIGKTAFAVHAAHRLTGAFPDGQFFCRCTLTPLGSGRIKPCALTFLSRRARKAILRHPIRSGSSWSISA
jgi:hypothetical protein